MSDCPRCDWTNIYYTTKGREAAFYYHKLWHEERDEKQEDE